MQTKGPLHTWPAKANIGRKQTIAENKSLRKTNHCRSLTTASTASFVRKFGRVTIPSLGEVRHRVYWFSLKIKWTSANKRQADFLNKLPINDHLANKGKKRKLFPWQRSPCNEPPVWRSPTRLDLPPEHLFVVSVWMSQIYQMVCWRARESLLYWLLSHVVALFAHRILWDVDKPLEIHTKGFVSFQQ